MGNNYKITKEIDLSGLNCPLPILRTKAALATMKSGDVLKIIATNPEFEREINTFSKQMNTPIIDSKVESNQLMFVVTKG